jgi:hypothetical protein
MFATHSSGYTGALGGIAGADAICQAAALNGGFGGTWAAVLAAGGLGPKQRLTIDGPVYNLHGSELAADATDLWSGDIAAPVYYSEHRYPVGGGGVLTGSDAFGDLAAAGTCTDWTVTTGTTANGASDWANLRWLEHTSSTACSSTYRLYCISQ